jgi:uncharacterized protein YjiS (DUF1127 family)
LGDRLPKPTICDRHHRRNRLPVLQCGHRMREVAMLSTTLRQTRTLIHEWRLRARSRRELAMLGELDRHDLCRHFDIGAEVRKPFWRA